MITYRKLNKYDNNFLEKLILNEGYYYEEFINMGWNVDEIIKQLHKDSNFSYGVFKNDGLVSFILGDLFNIEKISEYEILLIYVCKHFRKNGLGTTLINKIEENSKCLKKIYLEVSKNNHEGILFYKKMKFNIIHTRKNYFLSSNNRVDGLVMSKVINNEK